MNHLKVSIKMLLSGERFTFLAFRAAESLNSHRFYVFNIFATQINFQSVFPLWSKVWLLHFTFHDEHNTWLFVLFDFHHGKLCTTMGKWYFVLCLLLALQTL